MRFLQCSPHTASQCLGKKVKELSITTSPQVQLKQINPSKAGEHIRTTIRLCEELAAKLSRAFSEALVVYAQEQASIKVSIKEQALQIRQKILKDHGAYVDMQSIIRYCESRGIIVAHFNGVPQGKIDGAAIYNDEHPVILLGSGKTPMWVSYHLAHELGHIVLEHGATCFCKVEDDKQTDQQEEEANLFAKHLLLGKDAHLPFPSLWGKSAEVRIRFTHAGRARRVAPEIMALFAARRDGGSPASYASAQKAFPSSEKVHEYVNFLLKSRLDDLDIGEDEKESISRYLDYSGK